MKKIITVGLSSLLGVLLLSACSSKNVHPSDAKTMQYTNFSKKLTLKEAHKLIVKAGKKAGWRMTEFKDNAVIAEKTEDEQTIATTVYFNKDSFFVDPHNDDLQDAIEEALEE